jgi:Mor family transcriptional regulator
MRFPTVRNMNYADQIKAIRDRQTRDRDMRKMHDSGASHASIARKHGVSRERVAQIVGRRRAQNVTTSP